MEVTYYGHSCYMVNTGGKSILFDPFITPNPLAAGVNVDSLMPDYMLISHGHEDHVADAVRIARNSDCMLVAVWEVCAWLEKKGLKKTHAMNTGGQWNFEFGKLKLVQAVHSSSMPDGSTGGNPVGFVVNNEADCFYYSGDTALHLDMQLIPLRNKIKLAFLPIGSNFTMDVEDAITASQILHCTDIVGMHYDTFEYIKIDRPTAINAFAAAGITLHLPEIGETLNF